MKYFDDEGFQLLVRKEPDSTKKKEKKIKRLRDLKNPFKKGSWKFEFFKKLKRYRDSKFVEDFHFVKMENLLIYRKDDPKALISKTRFSQKELEKIADKYDDSYVLINAGENIFIKLSLKAYLKLIKINKMVISYRIQVMEDGEDEFVDYYEAEEIIDNINELMAFLNYYRQLAHGVAEVQARVCCYTWVNFKVKTLIVKQDGSTQTYKGDLNEVLRDYNITPLI